MKACKLPIPPPPKTNDSALNLYLEQQRDLLLRLVICGNASDPDAVLHSSGSADGQMLVWLNGHFQVLNVGNDGDVLTADASAPFKVKWAVGGGGGGDAPVESGTFDVNFVSVDHIQEVVVPATWVTPTSIVHIFPVPIATVDHDPQDAVYEGLYGSVVAVVDAVSFTAAIYAPSKAYGIYKFGYLGV